MSGRLERARVRASLLRSGWVPAALLLIAAAVALHLVARVSWRDVVVFGGYAVAWLMLPGTLLWRAVDRTERPRPLVADLSIGMLCGYLLEFPVYLGCLALGHPHAYVLWPLVVLLATLTHRRGRALWTRPTTAMPTWWTWSLAAVLGYVIAWWSWAVWRIYPSRGPELRSLYGDEYHHLMLSTELRYHFRPQNPDVLGSTLYYHWLAHLHVAASSWVTGIEPIVLLQSLVLPTMCVAVFVAFACAVVRTTGSAWAGAVAPLLLIAGPATLAGGGAGGVAVLDIHLSISPSAGFVFGPLLVGLLLCTELITGALRGLPAYALATLSFAAMLGAKSTSLPILMGGLVLLVLWQLLSTRRLHRPTVMLTALAVVVYLLVKPFFFGSGTGGVEVSILGTYGDGPFGNRAVAAVVFLLSYLSIGAPLLIALLRRSTRTAELVLLAGVALSAFGGDLATIADGHSEFYFMYAGLLALALGSGIALPRVLPDLAATPAARRMRLVGLLLLLVVVVAAAARVVVGLLPAPVSDPTATLGHAIAYYVVPNLIALAVTACLVTLCWLLARRLLVRAGLAVVVTAALGLGGVNVAAAVTNAVRDPASRPAVPVNAPIGEGGIEAARWLRAHSSPDTLVATNAHCSYPPNVMRRATCEHRNFWMAGFSERRFLVEGWSYITRVLGESITGPFWDPTRLQENDRTFLHPTAQRLDRLRHDYGVQWLFVDTRFPAQVKALSRLVTPAYRNGDYLVFDLRPGHR